jgi:UDP-2,3-diacylglucosamine hydrolase
MKAIFISDTHLRKAADERYVHLLTFFNDIKNGQLKALIDKGGSEVQVTAVTDIYIVGDLFDFWFCNKDKIYPEFILIIRYPYPFERR